MSRPIAADGTCRRSTGRPSREYAAAVGVGAAITSPGNINPVIAAAATRRDIRPNILSLTPAR
ncbi:hypothetical protein MBOE_10830 [Mycolicibacterium boenickei]|uniref:Uncharacterized protein n=1 Tax=Mycolicibacterium boenickei TaxID=146017 RepID=A0ABM7IRK4_9MYCO|nr:hypothetical protein MBOE_10830 [Mycolicibacterium boenickei]